jgi:hypothetical protein
MTLEAPGDKVSDSGVVIAEAISIMKRIKLHAETCDCCARALRDSINNNDN